MSSTWVVKKLCTVDSKRAIGGIAFDNNGNIYFTLGKDGLWRLNKDDMKPLCVVNDGSDMYGIVWNGKNILYICDWKYNRILSYAIDTGTISTLAGNRKEGHTDGDIKDTTFTLPWGIATSRNGDLYITELDRIRKINIGLGTVETFAGPTGSKNDNGYQNGDTKNAKFGRLTGIAVSNDGTIYVCDCHNCCIRQIKNGVVSTLAGTPGNSGHKDGTLRDALFSFGLGGIALTDGSLLVTDHEFRKVNMRVSTPQDLQAIRKPYSLAIDNEGHVYCGTTGEPVELWKITNVERESHIKSLLNNMTTWKHIRLFLVGDSGAGKTSVVRWLKGEKFNPNHLSTDSVEVSTTDANTWQSSTFDIKDYIANIINQPASAKELPTNDLSDENVPFYSDADSEHSLPQADHESTEAAIYLLVIDISKPIDIANKDQVKFWLDSITFYAPSSDIIVIGTHKDSLAGPKNKQDEQAQQLLISLLPSFKEYKYRIKKVLPVSCKEDDSSQMRAVLRELAEQNLHQSCYFSWLLLYDAIIQAADAKAPSTMFKLPEERWNSIQMRAVYKLYPLWRM